MLKDIYQAEIVRKEEKTKNKFYQFLDGRKFDDLLQFVLNGLYWGIILFCLPYFCFILISFLF